MNPKKEKLKTEKEGLIAKIRDYKEKIDKAEKRISEIDSLLTSITNSEYGAVMEAYNMTPEELADFLMKAKVKGKDA